MSGFAEYRQRMLDAIAVYDQAHAEVERIEAAATATWRAQFAGRRETMRDPTPEPYAVAVLARGAHDYDQALSRRSSALARVHTWAMVALVMRDPGPGRD